MHLNLQRDLNPVRTATAMAFNWDPIGLRCRMVKQNLFLASKQPYHLVRAVAHRWRLNEYFSLQISWSYDMVSGISPLFLQETR